MLYFITFLSIFSTTYTMHVLLNSIVNTYSFKVYKSKLECALWGVYCFITAYIAARFRVYENIGLSINSIYSILWMFSFHVFAKVNLKVSLKNAIKLGLLANCLFILGDILATFIIFKGFPSIETSTLKFMMVNVSPSVTVLFLILGLFLDAKRIDLKSIFNKKNIGKIALISVLISIAYFTVVNSRSSSERMRLEHYPIMIVTANVAVICLLIFVIVRMIKASERRKALRLTEIMTDYVSILENANEELRHYKHDIENILFGLREYIEAKDMINLRTYFMNDIKGLSPSRSFISRTLHMLKPLRINTLKGAIIGAIITSNVTERNLVLYADAVDEFEFVNVDMFSIMVGEIIRQVMISESNAPVENVFNPSTPISNRPISIRIRKEGSCELVFEIKSENKGEIDVLKQKLNEAASEFVMNPSFKVETIYTDGMLCRATLLN